MIDWIMTGTGISQGFPTFRFHSHFLSHFPLWLSEDSVCSLVGRLCECVVFMLNSCVFIEVINL